MRKMSEFRLKIPVLLVLSGIALSDAIGVLPPTPSSTRETLSLDGLWYFKTNDLTIPPNSKQVNVNTDLNLMPVPSSYNDVGTQKSLREYAGSVTYTRTFFVPPSWTNKRVWIRFGSVCYSANVTINGANVIQHSIGHLPFAEEVTTILNYGDQNEISVVVDNTLSDSTIPQGGVTTLENGILARTYTFDFFDYSGIDRSVILYTTSQAYLDDLTLTTSIYSQTGAIINYNISILGGDERTFFNILILDQSGNIIYSVSGQSTEGTITINNVNFWWPYTMAENPGYLYTFRVDVIQENLLVDRYDQLFGIRELSWDNNTFTINGRPIYFRGFGRHEDSDFRGKGTDLPLFIRDHNLIRWLGANSYRTSHYPYCEELMDLADRLGIMIIDEVPAVNIDLFGDELLENHKRAFTELHRRDKNRPSVVAWSCANEPNSQFSASAPYFQKVIEHIKSIDVTRPVTAAIAQSYSDDHLGQYLDIIGFNKYQAWYANTGDLDGITDRIVSEAKKWRAKYNKPVLMTEYGGDTLEGLHFLPTFIWSEEYQTTLMSRHFKAFDTLRTENDWFIGEHIWNFADFKTSENYVRVGGNKKGIFTRNRQPKSSAFLLRRRYWALANTLDNVSLPSDLEDYVEINYKSNDEL